MPHPDRFAGDPGLQTLEQHLRNALDRRAEAELEMATLQQQLDELRRLIDTKRELQRTSRDYVGEIEAQIVARRRSLAAGEVATLEIADEASGERV